MVQSGLKTVLSCGGLFSLPDHLRPAVTTEHDPTFTHWMQVRRNSLVPSLLDPTFGAEILE